jgi:hypothetical protein
MIGYKNILQQFADGLTKEIKDAINAKHTVTGKTAKSIDNIVTENSLIVFGNQSVGSLVHGRSPTQSSTEGTPTLYEIILQWVKDKGLQAEGNMSQEGLAFVITRSIHRNGTLLYQDGGRGNVLENIITDSKVNRLIDLVAVRAESIATELITKQIQAR